MTAVQRAGGVSALIQGAMAALQPVLFFLILPRLGIRGWEDFNDPAKILPAMMSSPLWRFIDLISLPSGILMIITALAFYDRLRTRSPGMMLIATATALVAGTLWVASSMVAWIAMPALARMLPEQPAVTEAAYLAVQATNHGLIAAAICTTGSWIFLLSWAALRTRTLPRSLSYLGLLLGVLGIARFASDFLSVIVAMGLIVWMPWVGSVLLRGRAGEAALMQPAGAAG